MMKYLFASCLLPSLAFANASGLDFSQEELNASLANSKVIGESAAKCIQRTWDEHNAFYKKNGYAKFYGSRRKDYATAEGRKAALLQILPDLARRVRAGDPAAIAELERREAELETTSCVGLAMKCTGEGFAAAGMDATWKKIYAWLGRPDKDGTPLFDGTDLQKALVDLGWKALYWNPDVSQNATWDEMDQELNPLKPGTTWNPVWGGHAELWNSILKRHTYYGIPVSDIQTLVNFGVDPPGDFKSIPYFVGTAHAGYHVFPGSDGKVIEAHSMRVLGSIDNMQFGPFNPLDQPENGVANGDGAPKWTNSEHYRSGVIVVPPNTIADKPFTPPPPARNVPPNVPVNPTPAPKPQPKPTKPKPCWFIFCSQDE